MVELGFLGFLLLSIQTLRSFTRNGIGTEVTDQLISTINQVVKELSNCAFSLSCFLSMSNENTSSCILEYDQIHLGLF